MLVIGLFLITNLPLFIFSFIYHWLLIELRILKIKCFKFSVQLLHKYSIHAADGPQKLLKVSIAVFIFCNFTGIFTSHSIRNLQYWVQLLV